LSPGCGSGVFEKIGQLWRASPIIVLANTHLPKADKKISLLITQLLDISSIFDLARF
jgi:hypothetical protein